MLGDVIYNTRKNIKNFLTPIKTYTWVKKNNCLWTGISVDGKWSYYWFGNFSTGYQVKVRIR